MRWLLPPAAGLVVLLAAPRSALAGNVSLSAVDTSWRLEPLVLVGIVVFAALFLQAWHRLRARGRYDHAGWDRLLLVTLGLALFVVALLSPLDHIGETYLLSAHMLQHMLIGDAAIALVLVAVRGPLGVFLLPRPVLIRLAHLGALRRLLHWLLRPGPAFGIWALVFAAWHIPAAYDYALQNQIAHDLEHLTFIAAGMLAWSMLIDPGRRGELSRSARLGFAAAMFAGGQVLAYTMIFSFSALYPAYANQPDRLFGLSPLADQKLAGLIMMLAQLVSLGLFALLTMHARPQARRGRELASPTPEPIP